MKRHKPCRPSPIIASRLQRCRKMMKQHRVDHYLVTNRADQYYLTGFNGEDGAVIVTDRQVHIITDGRFFEEFQRDVPWAVQHLRTNRLSDALAQACSKARLNSLFYQSDDLTVAGLQAMQSACQRIRFRPAPALAGPLRLIKDAAEVAALRRSIKVAEEAFQALRRSIRVGLSEREIAATLEYEMKKRGAIRPSFDTIVAEGSNAAAPHAVPGTRRVKKGSLLLIDWGALYDGYCSDLTRVLFIGNMANRFKLLYEIVLQAQQQAIAAIRPGRRMCDIDQIARDHITKCGYGKEFSHGLGHGIGLNIHEEPRLRPTITDTLKPGMVVTVEPGIYISGVGGIRIEDDILVTRRGHKVLTSLPKTPASAVVKVRR